MTNRFINHNDLAQLVCNIGVKEMVKIDSKRMVDFEQAFRNLVQASNTRESLNKNVTEMFNESCKV